MSSVLNVVCAKWGTTYSAEYVNRLYMAVLRNTQRRVNFFCVTDDPVGIDSAIEQIKLIPFAFQDQLVRAQKNSPKRDGAYTKVAMFAPDLLDVTGPVLAFDLDVVITGSIDSLADFAPGKVAMAAPFANSSKRPTYGEGSVIKFEPEHHAFLFTDLAKDTEAMVRRSYGSEQSYTSSRAKERGLFSTFPDDWVVSFKHHCRPIRPLNVFRTPYKPVNAKIVCFHGRPKIEEAVSGFTSDILHRTKPAPWILNYWK
jgi:hypothetical protein